ncbi:hypothetical protein L6164_002870 [Bauhinia variegata]|uniref:Uncharacterized protein n=1 Tax=Bauhinia variegata TaxID=167791 RepID=A0ACB9PYP3_BAUVA|nr:hypothetical protein L6164_002870 [Bauhinia variegata]
MSSPTIQHSVSDQTLGNSFKPSSSKIPVGKPRIWSKNDLYNMTEEGGSSPYYKGLTDQSLAVYKAAPTQLAPSIDHQSHHPSNVPLSPLESSRYYKGLIDYTLALSGKQPVSDGFINDLDQSFHSGGSLPCECSPYYKGLTDYTLALYGQQLAAHGSSASLGFNVSPNFTSMPLNLWTMCFPGSNPGPGYTSPSLPKTKAGCSNQMEPKKVNDDLGLVTEGKPLRERVSEPSMAGKVVEETVEIIATAKVGNYGLVGEEEKPLRESISVSEQRVVPELTLKAGYENQEKYTWANKYQPKALGDFICNKEKAHELQEMVKGGCGCKHFIFEAPPGVGKRTMIRCMLREVFGNIQVYILNLFKQNKGEMVSSIEMNMKRSTHHVEVNLSDTKGYEKHVLVDLFKETYENFLDNSAPCVPENCQAIVLYESEKLSKESLLYIKWLLERYKAVGCNKVFFCCSDESKLQPVKALCTTIKLKPPTCEEIVKVLEFIGHKEGIELPHNLAVKIVEKAKNNLRQAIRSFEATCQNKLPLEEDQLILTGWEDEISNIAKNTIDEQSPRQLYNIRRKLQNLMIHNVSPGFIFMVRIPMFTLMYLHNICS